MRCGALYPNSSLLFPVTKNTTWQFARLACFWYGDVLTPRLLQADEFLRRHREVGRASIEGVMRELNNINHIYYVISSTKGSLEACLQALAF